MPSKQGYKAVLPVSSPSGRVVIPTKQPVNPGLMPTNRSVAGNPASRKNKGA